MQLHFRPYNSKKGKWKIVSDQNWKKEAAENERDFFFFIIILIGVKEEDKD